MSRLIYGAAAAALLAFAAPASAQLNHPLHPSLESSAPMPPAHQTTAAPPAEQPTVMAQNTMPVAPAMPSTPGVFTDAQLGNFLGASTEIQPLTANLSSATPEQRTQITNQIRSALQSHNIDSTTYNAIASAAQTDPSLAARINGLRSGATASGVGANLGANVSPPSVQQPAMPSMPSMPSMPPHH